MGLLGVPKEQRPREMLEGMIAQYDLNYDGTLSYEEFLKMMNWAPEPPKEATPVIDPQTLVGDYVNTKNNYQHVKITVINKEAGIYRWSVQDEIKWTITDDLNAPDKLRVGEDCPFYFTGYKEAKLKFADGKVVSIYGPDNEEFTREAPKSAPVPEQPKKAGAATATTAPAAGA